MKWVLNLLLAMGISSSAAQTAQAVHEKNPLDYPIKHWIFILIMALLGGFANWYTKVRKGELAASNMLALIGEFLISALAGLIAFLVCDWMGLPIGITGAAAGLAGHAGAKGLSIGEALLQREIERRAGLGEPRDKP